MNISVTLFFCLAITIFQDTPEVHVAGALRTIMAHQLRAQISMADVPDIRGVYGLGAAENLEGELVILDGTVYWSRVAGQQVVTETSRDKDAALLVYSVVPEWQTIQIPDNIMNMAQLETWINAMNVSVPFPFRLTGQPESVSWHVIDWDPSDPVHTHAKHRNAGMHGTTEPPENTDMIGFYSRNHKGIFTHHSTNLHLHALLEGNAVHVDALNLTPTMTLFVPADLPIR